MTLPSDYAERVYAGVLGKTIGVYLGRPFEGWPYEMIQKKLGDIEYYVHDKLGVPLIVPDDDIAGTFTFLRALGDHDFNPHITAADIGETWLNYLIENRTILWWGGLGNSTEHTAYLRLKKGIKAPESGSEQLNTKVIAEQIGAQIFIDGWAMVSPGDAGQAARLAQEAARVSHDGEAVYGAVVLAVMEAMAFIERDTDKLLDTALGFVPSDSIIRRMIDDLHAWHKIEPDWREARIRLAADYGYDTYGGNCHMVPNHGLIILSLLYGEDDFSTTMKIINTCGWDTDCNSGNIGCLMGIKLGLEGIEAGLNSGKDWRGPVADRLYIPNADPTWGLSDCLREAQEIVTTAQRMRGQTVWSPKQGAQFHFEMPGSCQGFMVTEGDGEIENLPDISQQGQHVLRLSAHGTTRFGTPVFTPSKSIAKGFESRANPYPIVASPRLYPGQTLTATLLEGAGTEAKLYLAYYGTDDTPELIWSEPLQVEDTAQLTLTVPPEAWPAFEVGIETSGTVHLDALSWSGEPDVTFTRPEGRGTMWQRAWVDGIDDFIRVPWVEPYRLVQNQGRGLLIQGNREWQNITVTADLEPHLMVCAGVAVRVQGMRRYYALLLHQTGEARLVKVLREETILASCPVDFAWGERCDLSLTASGADLTASVNGKTILEAQDQDLTSGGIALVVEEGRTSTHQVSVKPA